MLPQIRKSRHRFGTHRTLDLEPHVGLRMQVIIGQAAVRFVARVTRIGDAFVDGQMSLEVLHQTELLAADVARIGHFVAGMFDLHVTGHVRARIERVRAQVTCQFEATLLQRMSFQGSSCLVEEFTRNVPSLFFSKVQ